MVVALVITINVTNSNKQTQEQKLEAKLEDLGKDFFENFYYPQVGSDDSSRATFLEKFSEIGIKVNLDNLSRYNGEGVEDKIAEEILDGKVKDGDTAKIDYKDDKVVVTVE